MSGHGFTATALGVAAISLVNPTAQHPDMDNGIVQPEAPHTSQWGFGREAISWGSLAERVAWGRLRIAIQGWKSLPADWDGDGGAAPTKSTIESSIAFLGWLETGGAPLPSVGVAGDGEIEFKWIKDNRFASASFLSDGHLVAYVRGSAADAPIEVDEPATESVGRSLLKSIAAFA